MMAPITCAPPTPLPAGEAPPDGAFTLVVLPDTQGYAYNYLWDTALAAQLRWIAENADSHDIRYVLHVGDIVNENLTTQWQVIRHHFDHLHDGDRVRAPYALVDGNHDLGRAGTADGAESRWTLMTRDDYFGPNSPYGRQRSIGGFFEKGRTSNTWHEFAAGGKQWLILALEFGPRDAVVDWAGEVLDAHPEHRAIIVTHAYLHSSNARQQYVPFGGIQAHNPHSYPLDFHDDGDLNDGEALWAKLVKTHANVRLVLSGHTLDDGEGRLTSVGDHGHVVHQLVQNYQPGVIDSEFGGSGYLRLMEFWPDGETVRVRTYSPYLGEYMVDPGHEFFITLHDQQIGFDPSRAIADEQPLLHYRTHLSMTGGPGTVSNGNTSRPDLEGIYEGDGAGPWAFDGDDAIRVAAPLPRLEQWTLEAWVRPTLRGSGQVIFSNDRPPDERTADAGSDTHQDPTEGEQFTFHDDVILGVSPEGSKFTEEVTWTVVHRDQSGARTLAQAPTRVLADRWVHLAATADGAHLRLYVDGALIQETATEGEDLALDAAPALIGRSDHLHGAAYHGEIAELALHDRALSAAAIHRHHLAAFARVTAARIEVAGTVDPDGEEYEGLTLAEQGLPGLSVTVANRGDLQVFHGAAEGHDPRVGHVGGAPLASGDGVLLPTIAENARSGVVGSAAASWNSWNSGIVGVSVTEVGASEDREIVVDDVEDTEEDPATPSLKSLYDAELTVLNEINMDVAVAWFPFRAGWRGGHVGADARLIRGNGLTQAMLRPHPDAPPEAQRLLVDLEVDAGDGLLFAVGADGKNRVVVAAPRDTVPGWELRVQSNSVALADATPPVLEDLLDTLMIPAEERERIKVEKLLTRDSVSLLYLPLAAKNLVAGRHDGFTGADLQAVGAFVLTPQEGPGEYHLEITGESPQSGMLVLTGADLGNPRNVALSYEDDGAGSFEIRAWEVETAAPVDTIFAWAFIDYNDPPALR